MYALLFFGLILVAAYVLILRPQRRHVLAHRALIASLEVGDEIITAGGVYGTIRAIDDSALDVEIASGVMVRLARNAVASKVIGAEDATTGPEDAAPRIDGTTD